MKSRCRTSSKTSSTSLRPQTIRGANPGSLSSGRCSADELHPVAEPDAMRGAHQHLVVYFEVLHQDVEDAPRHPFLDLEEGGRAVPQLAQPLIDGFEKVVGLVFLDHHVGVADDAEHVRALDRRAREERLDVGAHDVLDEDEGGAAAGKAPPGAG